MKIIIYFDLFNKNLCFVQVKYNPKKTSTRCSWFIKIHDINRKKITMKFEIVLENNVLAVCANKAY